MSTISPPTAPPAQVQAQAAQGQQVVAMLAGADPGLAQADLPDNLLPVLIQARAGQNVLKVLSDLGEFSLKFPGGLPALPAGAKMVLQLVQHEGQLSFRLVSVNGRPMLPGGLPLVPQGPGSGLSAGAALLAAIPGASGQAQQAQGAGAVPLPGQPHQQGPAGITATLLRPAGTPAAGLPPGLAPDLPPGTQLVVRIAGLSPPGAPPPAAPMAPAPAQPASAQPSSAQAASTMPQPGASQPSGGTVGGGAPAAIPPQPMQALQGVPTSSPAAAPSLPTLAGTVVGQGAGGQALVQTPAGTLSLPTQHPLPQGTQMALELVDKPIPPSPAQAPAAAKPDGLTASGWPSLSEASETLAKADPQAADALLRAIPQANQRLAAGLSLFAGALMRNDLRPLLGDAAVKGLEKAGRRDLADKLKAEFESLSADSARPVGNGDWRALSMPFLNGAQVDAIRLFVRNSTAQVEEDGRRKDGGGEHRFVLEVNMSQLGRMQFDGLVQRTNKRFDLIIRTGSPLEEKVRRDISGIFAAASELTGTKGQVVFQSGGRFVEFPPAAAASATRITV